MLNHLPQVVYNNQINRILQWLRIHSAMFTRSKHNIRQPRQFISLLTHSFSSLLLHSRSIKRVFKANSNSQEEGIDFSETFSLVVTIGKIILHVVLTRDWTINQLDVHNAFFQEKFTEAIYMFQRPGFVHKYKLNHVCKLKRSIYGVNHMYLVQK